MEVQIVGELRMERGPDAITLLNGDNVSLVLGQRSDPLTHPRDDRRTNEDAHNRLFNPGHFNLILEAVDLRTKGVAADRNVEQVERVLIAVLNLPRHHDHSHASAPDRHAAGTRLNNRFAQSESLHEDANGCAFPARQNDALAPLQVFGSADFTHRQLRINGSKRENMLLKVALNGDYAYNPFHFLSLQLGPTRSQVKVNCLHD